VDVRSPCRRDTRGAEQHACSIWRASSSFPAALVRPSPRNSPDNPTARDLGDQLPLTLRFRDFNRVDKIAELYRPLTTDGVPSGDDPEINDIGYAPSDNLGFYYGESQAFEKRSLQQHWCADHWPSHG